MKLFGTMKVEDNQLTIGGAKASDLVKEYGSPLYVFDEELIREYCRDYRNYFRCEENNNRVAFAGKAFLTVQMCKLLKEENMSLDVVSGGELYTAYKAGFPLERVMFHGNNKTLDEIELGVKLGVGNFVVDNHYEMEVLNDIAKSYGKTQNIYLRITPGIEAHTHDYIKTGQIDSKFGFAPVGTVIEDAVEKAINLENINLAGIHCHIGSQIFELQPYEDAVEVMLDLVKKIQENHGYFIKEVDFGGGFGILVMFGLHWVLISLGLSTIAIQGFDYMMACGSIGPMIGMFQGLALCVAARKNRKVSDLAIPATISQICGVGEPLMYSVLIPLKKPLYLNIAGGAIGGAILGLLQTKLYMFGGSGLFSFPNFVNPVSGQVTDLVKYAVSVLIAGVFTFIVQLIIYKDKDAEILNK